MGLPEFSIFRDQLVRFVADYGEETLPSLKDRIGERHFSEAFLMSVIRANRPKAVGKGKKPKPDLVRLTHAHAALFGGTPSSFANNKDNERALTWMAEQREMDRREVERGTLSKPRSDKRLAELAFGHFSKHPGDSDVDYKNARPQMSSADHLRKKFPEFWRQRQERRDDAELTARVAVIQKAALEELEIILRLFGVECQFEE